MPTFQTTIELDIEVEYACLRGDPGHRDRYGAPDEGAHDPDVELLGAVVTHPAATRPPLAAGGEVRWPRLDLSSLDRVDRRRLENEARAGARLDAED